MPKRNPRRTDKEWLDLIQECRSSGLSDKCWCQEHHIHTSNFYYQIRRLRQKACEIPEPVHSSFSGKQEVNKIAARWPAKAVAQLFTFSKKGSDRIVPR